MSNKQSHFHPLLMIPTVLEITREVLDASQKQLGNMKKAKDEPYLLDDHIIHRSLNMYEEQNKDSDFFLQQCSMWKQEKLTDLQLKQVQEIENSTQMLRKVNDQLLSILNYCKDFTIDKILEKGEMELALDVLTGKIPFPKI